MKLLELIILHFLGVEFKIHLNNTFYYLNEFCAFSLPSKNAIITTHSNKEVDLVWVDFVGMPNSKNLLIYTKATGLIYENLRLTDKFKLIDVDNFIKHQKQLWGV